MTTTRRYALRASVAGLLALGLKTKPQANAQSTETRSRLPAKLARQRAAIRTFRAHLEITDTRKKPLFPQTQLFYDRGKYHLHHHHQDGGVIEVVTTEARVQAAVSWTGAINKSVSGPNRTPDRPRHINLSTIMPVFADRHVFDQGTGTVDTHICRKLLQRDALHWVDVSLPFVRLLEFYWKGPLPNEVVRYGRFAPYEGIYVPRVFDVTHRSPTGRRVGDRSIRITDIEINGYIDAALFDTGRYVDLSERKEIFA